MSSPDYQQLQLFELPPEPVLERPTYDPAWGVREQLTPPPDSAPEHTHWTESYWVERKGTKHFYYRYCYMEGRKISHVHIPGGNIRSSIALARLTVVESAIAARQSPQQVKQLIRSWTPARNKTR